MEEENCFTAHLSRIQNLFSDAESELRRNRTVTLEGFQGANHAGQVLPVYVPLILPSTPPTASAATIKFYAPTWLQLILPQQMHLWEQLKLDETTAGHTA